MFYSLKLGKFFGIDLFVHGTFWLLPLVILASDVAAGDGLAAIAIDLAFIFAVFGCIVLHEVGHALAARAYGIGTRDITLYPVGGIASLERMPEKPGREIAIALAGPAVNLVIAAALFVVLLAESYVIAPTLSITGADPIVTFVARLMLANLFLCGFNLLPAFPMDGGRVLRALLAIRMTRLRATLIAVRVGTLVAAGFLVFGVMTQHLGLVALAIVVYLLGQAELAMVSVGEAERLIRERVGGFFAPPGDDGPVPVGGPPSPGFSGLAWDETRRVWVEWKNGVAVGGLPPAR